MYPLIQDSNVKNTKWTFYRHLWSSISASLVNGDHNNNEHVSQLWKNDKNTGWASRYLQLKVPIIETESMH